MTLDLCSCGQSSHRSNRSLFDMYKHWNEYSRARGLRTAEHSRSRLGHPDAHKWHYRKEADSRKGGRPKPPLSPPSQPETSNPMAGYSRLGSLCPANHSTAMMEIQPPNRSLRRQLLHADLPGIGAVGLANQITRICVFSSPYWTSSTSPARTVRPIPVRTAPPSLTFRSRPNCVKGTE